MQYKKAWGRTLAPVSKERLAKGGPFGLRRKKPMKAMSDNQRAKVKSYRAIGFGHRGKRCFLCGRGISQTLLVVHHYDCNRNNNDPDNLFPLCDRNFGCHAHNHMGKEGLAQLNKKIDEQLKRLKDE